METVAFSILLLPLLSALITLLFLRKSGNIASLLSVATSGGILVFALYLIFNGGKRGFYMADNLDENGGVGIELWLPD